MAEEASATGATGVDEDSEMAGGGLPPCVAGALATLRAASAARTAAACAVVAAIESRLGRGAVGGASPPTASR